MKANKFFLRLIIGGIILAGISAIWTCIDISMYGESQKSVADAIAAVFMTHWIDNRLWSNTNV